tara:strand:- start:96 stop:797 length:702 start_codon:yes stop_codon:yes gene_type:complete
MSVQNTGSDTYPVPLGTVVFYSAFGSVDPNPEIEYVNRDLGEAWLCCDGRYLPRVGKFSALFKMIGTTFGTTTADDFRLPVAAEFNSFGVRGLLPRTVLTNDGAATLGDGGTCLLSATLTEANIPPISWNGDGTPIGRGFDTTNAVYTSAIVNGRSVMQNDPTGAGSAGADVNGQFMVRAQAVDALTNIVHSVPATIERLTAVPTALSQSLALKGEIPQRYEMRMMIRAFNGY